MNKFYAFLLLMFVTSIGISFSQMSKMEKWQSGSNFRGFTMSVWVNTGEGREVNQADFDNLKAIGATLVVIETQGSMDEDPPYGQNEYYREGDYVIYHIDMLDSMVSYARNAGLMYVIAVRDGPGRADVSADTGQTTIWTNQYEQQLYGQMLKEMAGRYLPDTLFVGMTLTEEPNPLGELWEPPIEVLDSALQANGIDLNALQALWIDLIRTVDQDLPLLVGGVHANHPEYFSLMKKQADDNIVYKVHLYNPADYSHSAEPYSMTYPGEYWSARLQGLYNFDRSFLMDELYKPVRDFQTTYNVPIFVGEFGIRLPQNGGEQYLSDIGSIACEFGWSYAIWNFNNGTEFNYHDLDSIYGTDYYSIVKSLMYCSRIYVDPPEQLELIVAPNPASDEIYIQTVNEMDMEIINELGIKVLERKNIEPERGHSINVSGLGSGIYILRLRDMNVVVTKKFVIY